jgi:hypothetical protein
MRLWTDKALTGIRRRAVQIVEGPCLHDLCIAGRQWSADSFMCLAAMTKL